MDAAAATEWIRTAPEREAAARAAALFAANTANDEKLNDRTKSLFFLVVGAVVGAIGGFIAALVLALPVLVVGGL